ncbi:DUF4399 domain-containing protein [Streptomyces kutzneri]|uniref:DUF4399 domain-containing protein n=1 Tax=Streptomyces kutzneri TaxID=3051179 RepID=UPI0034D97978
MGRSLEQVWPPEERHLGRFNERHQQTATTLTLPPGVHRLTLQFADGMNRSYGPDMSQTISVTVR